MKVRLLECAANAESLVSAALSLAEQLGEESAHNEKMEQLLALATTLRSDLRRLSKYAAALDED